MTLVHVIVGAASLGFTGVAAVWGSWCWFRGSRNRVFWWLLRAGQAAIVVEAVLGGIWEISPHHRASELHLIYGLVPIAVSFVAEQLRIAAAQMVLDARGFDSAQEVGALPESEQRVVMLTIVQRELGVMVLAAIVMAALLARAMGTGG